MFLEYRIHGVKSRIQACLGFPRTGRNKGTGNLLHFHWQFYFISKGQPRHEPRFHVLFFGPNLRDLFSTSWTIMAHQTLALRPPRNCANCNKLRCCKGTLAAEFHSLKRVQGQLFEKFWQKRDIFDEELEKHSRLEIVRPKNSAASPLNSPSRTLVETNFLSIVN